MGTDETTLHCEVDHPDTALSEVDAITVSIRDATKLRGNQPRLASDGVLPNKHS